MFRLWGKIWKENRMVKDLTICRDTRETRTHKIFESLNEMCDIWDLGKPIWLNHNISDFRRMSKTRFSQDNFIEHIDFDYLEIQIIEEG